MTPNNAAARGAIATSFGEAAAERVAAFLDMVVAENAAQNLISPATVELMWSRHAHDSAQLLRWDQSGMWLDIGTGGGFPGMVVALLRTDPVTMVEPRKRRAQFLQDCAERLGLQHATVVAIPVEKVALSASVISARAVASVEKLLQMAAQCATSGTRWLLPRGRFGEQDLHDLRSRWQGMFHVEHSLTDPSSSILILEGVERR